MEPRRTIEEWITLFEIEPTFQHVFVEGENDQRIIDALFDALDRTSVAVRTAQEVELPKGYEALLHCPFSSGNRARLRIFAHEIERRATRALHNVRCVIDKDCDTILPFVADSSLILVTDFANLPISFIEYEPIRYVINAVFGRRLESEDFRFVVEAAKYLAACRICRYSVAPQARGVEIDKSISIGPNNQLEFDRRNYVTRLAISRGLGNQVDELINCASALLMRFKADPRCYINHHDFTALLFIALKLRRSLPSGVSAGDVERVIRATINKDRMLAVPMLKDLADWAK